MTPVLKYHQIRSFPENSPRNYRFGFQGQETDPEYLSGAVSFKYRVHDARLGRFLSLDPLGAQFPWNSPYAFCENRLIDGLELEGLEWSEADRTTEKIIREISTKDGKTEIEVVNVTTILKINNQNYDMSVRNLEPYFRKTVEEEILLKGTKDGDGIAFEIQAFFINSDAILDPSKNSESDVQRQIDLIEEMFPTEQLEIIGETEGEWKPYIRGSKMTSGEAGYADRIIRNLKNSVPGLEHNGGNEDLAISRAEKIKGMFKNKERITTTTHRQKYGTFNNQKRVKVLAPPAN